MLSVIIVGGSIAGLACARALLLQSYHVTVLERVRAPKTQGAGLGLDSTSHHILRDQLGIKGVPYNIMNIQENRSASGKLLFREENYGYVALQWTTLYDGLLEALPPGVVLFGCNVIDFEDCNENGVKVYVEGKKDPFVGDILVGADGITSLIRSKIIHDNSLRYAGYVAWRGVVDVSNQKHAELEKSIRSDYPDLGHCCYFEMSDTMGSTVFYEVPHHALNWLWYVNQPLPKFNTITAQPDEHTRNQLILDAKKVWGQTFANLIANTPKPFMNIIYDREPIQKWHKGRVILIGDAAHGTTPHGLRSTSMSLKDGVALAKALKAHPNPMAAFKAFEISRVQEAAQDILHSRFLGQLKQGLVYPSSGRRWEEMTKEELQLLTQRAKGSGHPLLSKL